MRTLKKMCAIVLSSVMVLSMVSTTVFAAEPNLEVLASEDFMAEYLAEMDEYGLSEADIAELRDWNLRVANADSMLEIDELMDEYQAIVAGTSLATSATATSFNSSSMCQLCWQHTAVRNSERQDNINGAPGAPV